MQQKIKKTSKQRWSYWERDATTMTAINLLVTRFMMIIILWTSSHSCWCQ
jgi:hypothetical protein